jgi:hypothetical protein
MTTFYFLVQWGLVCQERLEFEDVTGCVGLGTESEDYCIDPKNIKGRPLVIVANDKDGKDPNGKLKYCEGDCDTDDDCAVSKYFGCC